ncbi:MAG: ribonuclease D [Coleofasciculaceae cyanobacterium]
MQYFTSPKDIRSIIAKYAQAKTLWLDVEVADFQTSKPRLSLIQVLDKSPEFDSNAFEKENSIALVSILDVLEQSSVVDEFREKIMLNPAIEKVFHNAKYDLNFLGKSKAKKVTCTLEMARKIPYYLVPLANYQLKTLAEQLCHLPTVDKTEQEGDWGKRPLTAKQLHYAAMDTVYLAQVHQRLLQLEKLINPDPTTEDIEALTIRYRQLEQQWKQLDTEINHIKERIKAAMAAQQVSETAGFKLSNSQRTTKKVNFEQLSQVTQALGIELDLSVTLTKALQKQLGEAIAQLPVQEEVSINQRLSIQDQEDEELPF